MKEFKVGDEVFDLHKGNGEVCALNGSAPYIVAVKFKTHVSETYTIHGNLHFSDISPSLYHGHDLIVTVTEPEYEWQFIFKNIKSMEFQMSGLHYKSSDSICFDEEVLELYGKYEPSKRLVKKH